MSLTTRIVATAAAIPLLAVFHPALPTGFAGQENVRERVIKKESWPVKEPVKIIGLKVKGKEVEAGKKFDADEDWLSGLTVKVKNFSDKPIVHIEVEAWLFRAEAERDPTIYPTLISARFGYRRGPGDPVLPGTPDPLPPGGVVDLVFTADAYSAVEYHQARYNVGRVKGAELIVECVIFDDGLMLSKGTPMRRDPNTPYDWVPDRTVKPQRINLLRPQARPRQAGTKFDLLAAGFYSFRARDAPPPAVKILPASTGRPRWRDAGGVARTISSPAGP